MMPCHFGNGSFFNTDVWHQDVFGVAGARETNDRFSWSLSSGDFNIDGTADLLVGVPFEDLGSIYNTGVVQLIWGQGTGLTTSIAGQQLFHQGSFNGWGFASNAVATESEVYDYFGWTMP